VKFFQTFFNAFYMPIIMAAMNFALKNLLNLHITKKTLTLHSS